MSQHHTAFFENTLSIEGAEEPGAELLGLGPFSSFLDRYCHHFHSRTRPSFHKRATHFVSGLFQLQDKRNLERIDRRVYGSEYQSLQHFMTDSPWDDVAVCDQIAKEVNQHLGGYSDTGLFIDPAGFPKKGKHSVAVGRQYCGNLGKVDNCQVGVFSALGRGRDACLINKRLFLPREWCNDEQRCRAAGIPDDCQDYKTHAALALELIEEADRQGLDYAWIGMDAEFGNFPWLLLDLDDRNKTFLIDIPCSAYLYTRNPRMTVRPNSIADSALRLQRKAVKAEALRQAHGKRKWRRISIRDSSRGEMIADFLHKKIWYWDGDPLTKPRLWHLIIRRTPKEGEDGWEYKYSLSNAPVNTKTQVLAYRQSQRFWVEQAIKDVKDGLGIDEYQVRKWRAWHHHFALTMLAALFVLETRLKHRQTVPLLSITDVREILEFLLPLKVQTIEDLWAIILKRHCQRLCSYLSAKRRKLLD